MAQISISITKKVTFRDSIQHFSNVYTYGSIVAEPAVNTANLLIDEVAEVERSLHSTDVTFVKGRLWSSGGTIAQNEMITEYDLVGQGSGGTSATSDRERALLVMWAAGKNSRGAKVYLRKWYHCCGAPLGVTISAAIERNTTKMDSVNRGAVASLADGLTRIGLNEEWGLIANSGRERDGDAPTCHPYFEHHQLGNEWRGN